MVVWNDQIFKFGRAGERAAFYQRHRYFQFSVQFSPGFQIVKVSADFADDVCCGPLSANLGWKVVEPATE